MIRSYLNTDSLGSVRGIVSATGALTATTSYDAWGNPQTTGGLTAYSPFGYAGAYTDPNGLLYLINRYYNPATGQFLSVDPAVSATQEPYSYAGGNPVVTNSDPTGLLFMGAGPSHQTYALPYVPSYNYGAIYASIPTRTPAQTHRPPAHRKLIRKAATRHPARARAPRFSGLGCNPFVFKLGACPSERGAAGTTPQQVKHSLIGALLVLTIVIPIGDIIDAIGGAGAREVPALFKPGP